MKTGTLAIAALPALVLGCASHEGQYSPSCQAYVGSNITLDGGRFVWEKFTDQVVVHGNEVQDPFPGYPMRGSYRVDGDTLTLEPEAGEPISLYLQRHGDRHYLLTVDEFDAYKSTGEYADCALVHGGRDAG